MIFSESNTEISEIFHEKRGSSYSQGFGIQKQFLNSLVLLFFADNTSSVGRSLTFRVSAYTVPLKSKLPVASRFRRDANRVARYANRVARYAIRVARESSKRKMSGIN